MRGRDVEAGQETTRPDGLAAVEVSCTGGYIGMCEELLCGEKRNHNLGHWFLFLLMS